MHALWATIPGGHKWLHYFPIYEELLAARRSAPIKVLELGVYRGASLELWHKYFHSGSTIVGIDIDETFRNLSTTMGHSTGLIREQCPVW